MTPAKIYPFSIPAGGSFPLLVIGDYCKILTSSGALTLTGDTFGTIGPILAGQGIESSPFKRLVLNDNTGAVNSGTILVADNKFVDDRITGSVEVIDGGKNRTYSNLSFQGVLTSAASVGNFTHVAIANLAGSGKNVVLKAYRISTDNADIVLGGFIAGTLTTDDGFFKSKLSGIENSTAKMNIQNNATQLFFTRSEQIRTQVGANANIILQEPLVIAPGYNFCFVPFMQNNGISVALEFNEEAIL